MSEAAVDQSNGRVEFEFEFEFEFEWTVEESNPLRQAGSA